MFPRLFTINHELLVAKLHIYGFDKPALILLRSYLSNRWQRSKFNTSFSTWSELIFDVPQGSFLGLFFDIKNIGICNYADDNTLIFGTQIHMILPY